MKEVSYIIVPGLGDQRPIFGWYRAGAAAEKALDNLSDASRANMFCLIPKIDRVVEPERQRIDGATIKRMNAGGHLWGIAAGLVWHRRAIRRFVNERL